MGTEHTTIGVKFIDNDVFQVLKECDPFGMVGEDAGMKHVRIGDNDVPFGSNGLSSILRGISIIGERADRPCRCLDQLLKLTHLVLGKGLCRKEIDGPNGWIFQLIIENGKVITEGLPRSRRCDHYHILASTNCVKAHPLVRKELLYPLLFEGFP